MTIYDKKPIDNSTMNAIAGFMDDDIREQVHYELAPYQVEETEW